MGTEEFLDWPEKHHDYSHLNTTFYNDEELERYRNTLSKLLHLNQSLLDKWMYRLQVGSDEPLKVLLMAMSPKLTKATFVEYDSWQAGERVGERSYPFRMFASAIRALAPLPYPKWPCFQNLKIVYVGYLSDLRCWNDVSYPLASVIAPLFLLPAIEELYFNFWMGEENESGLDLEDDERKSSEVDPYVWGWELGRSSCQKLTCKWP